MLNVCRPGGRWREDSHADGGGDENKHYIFIKKSSSKEFDIENVFSNSDLNLRKTCVYFLCKRVYTLNIHTRKQSGEHSYMWGQRSAVDKLGQHTKLAI